MKNKITTSILCFLLLIPFRLPISILLIKFFNWIIGITTTEIIPQGILATNVIITKLIYNIAISCIFVYSLETFSRQKFGRKAKIKNFNSYDEMPVYWYIIPIIIILVGFIIVDGISVYDIFFYSKK